jgi:hypothetical protein
MYAINVVLVLGAFFLALFSFIFVAGSSIHLVGLMTQALRAMARPRSVNAEVLQSEPAAGSTIARKLAQVPRRSGPAMLPASRTRRYGLPLAQPGWLRTAAAVLGLVVVGFAGFAVTDRPAWSLHTVAAPTVQGAEEATAAGAANAPEERSSAAGRLSPGPTERIGSPESMPRECSTAQGIVTDCSFN